MKNKNLWIASLAGAGVSLLASNLPFINLINCLLCAGFWGSAVFFGLDVPAFKRKPERGGGCQSRPDQRVDRRGGWLPA